MRTSLTDLACDLERALLDPAVRSDRMAVAKLLHPDFVEFGASGRRWSRGEVLDLLAQEDAPYEVDALDMHARHVADTAVLVTYRSRSRGREAWRSSLWIEADGRVQIIFHQGTPVT